MASGRWHAWPQGSRATCCGTVNAEHLRQRPAKRVAAALPLDADRCGTCVRLVGVPSPADTPQDPQAAAWHGVIARRLVQQHLRGVAGAKLVARYASLVALVGPTTDQAAIRVFNLTWPIFFHVRHVSGSARLPGLRAALEAVSDDPAALARVADGVAAWQEIAGGNAIISRERFAPDRVIATILRAKDPRGYVQLIRQHEPDVKFLAALWHPDRYDRYEKRPDARGLLRGGPAYWAQTNDQLSVITDEE